MLNITITILKDFKEKKDKNKRIKKKNYYFNNLLNRKYLNYFSIYTSLYKIFLNIN